MGIELAPFFFREHAFLDEQLNELVKAPSNEWWCRMDLADWPNLSLIEMACQFQSSAIQMIDAYSSE